MRLKLIFLFCIVLVLISPAQKNTIDSLRNSLKTVNDTSKINNLILIARHHFNNDPDSSLNYLNKAQQLSKAIDYKKGLKEITICNSIYWFLKNDFAKSIEFAEKTATIKGPDFTKEFNADAYTLIANGYLRQNMHEKSITNYHLALALYEKLKIRKKEAMVLNNIGNLFNERGHPTEAIKYYGKSIEIRLAIAPEKELITPYNNIGNCYFSLKDYKKALEYQLKALNISLKYENPFNIANCYQNMGNIYYGTYEYEKSLFYRLKALNIFRNTDYQIEATSCYLGCAQIYSELKDYKKALLYGDSARVIADSIDYIVNRQSVYKTLANINKLVGNYKDALDYFEIASGLNDSIRNENTDKMVTEMQTKYDSEKKDIEILVQKTEIEKQNTQRNGFIIGSGLLLILLLFILRSFYQKKKANKIITEQKLEVEKQKVLVEENRKEIIDSINYAKRIQQALLPPQKYISKNIERLKK